jgi:hypothetical protein
MGRYGSFLKELLGPLGVYDLTEGTLNESELQAIGYGLDFADEALEHAEREALAATAEDVGLSRREALFARKPAAPTTALRRAAITALMAIDGDSLTPAAIDQAISGCGIRAKAIELDSGHIRVVFPQVAGEPAEFQQIQKIILDILPCHLETEFYFRYLTWAECEAAEMTWAKIEGAGHTWASFELAVPEEE